MTSIFHELLLSELRMVVFQPGDPELLTDRLLCEAVTLNENLLSLGYTLKPQDLVKLAVSPSAHGFYRHLRSLVPDVTAQPMYPGFPQQVMKISRAEFRLHQMMHYFSTYRLESLLGIPVSRGWLPAYRGPQRTQPDTTLLEAKVLDLVAEEDAPLTVLRVLLGRRERLTNPEQSLILQAAPLCSAEALQGLTVRFKENLDLLFPRLVQETDRATALRTLRVLCAHTGDVLRCTAAYLSQKKYHLVTSEKKLLVRLLEQYSVENFRLNLIQSQRLRERNLTVLRHLDYNRFSRSADHAEAVRALRSDELLSWNGVGELLLKTGSPKALAHLAQRPGFMIRMLNRLQTLGYSQEAIEAELLPQADRVSAHLILRVLRTIDDRAEIFQIQHRQELEACRQRYAQLRFQSSEEMLMCNYLWRRRFCTDNYQREADRLSRETLDRKYLQAREACQRKYRIERDATSPETLQKNYLRRKDSILSNLEFHLQDADRRLLQFPGEEFRKEAAAMVRPLQQELQQLQAGYTDAASAALKRWPHLKALLLCLRQTHDLQDQTDAQILQRYYPHFLQEDPKTLQLKARIAQLQSQLLRAQAEADAWLEEKLQHAAEEGAALYEQIAAQRRAEADRALAELEESHPKQLQQAAEQRSTIPIREARKLAQLEQEHLRECEEAAAELLTLLQRQARDLEELDRRHEARMAQAPQILADLDRQEAEDVAALEQTLQENLRQCHFDSVTAQILKNLLRAHFRKAATPLQGKKVFLKMDMFDLKHSVLQTSDRSRDGGYIRSGIAYRIPEEAKIVRFFTYWNDSTQVDIDLHVGGVTTDGAPLHVGWNADFRNSGVFHSGDIIHSNAAEYIDIDLSAPIREISANVNLFCGRSSFRHIQTCYVGLMAVDQMGQDVKLYSPENCFFTHRLTQDIRSIFYGYIDVANRCVRFVGQPNLSSWGSLPAIPRDTFSLQDYLDCLLEGQQVQLVSRAKDAEVILTMAKSPEQRTLSLVDQNFFLEC